MRFTFLILRSKTALRCSTSHDSRLKTSDSSFCGDDAGADVGAVVGADVGADADAGAGEDDDNLRMALLVTGVACKDVDFAPKRFGVTIDVAAIILGTLELL